MPFIDLLFLLGPLLVLPPGMLLLRHQTCAPGESALLRAARWAHPFAAIAVVSSFGSEPGRLATWLTIPWLVFTIFLGLIALWRCTHGGFRWGTICYTAALAYLPVGAIGLWASRAGFNLGGFGEPIIMLTAVHFHFSGFGASLIAGEMARRLPESSWARQWIILGACLGTPLIATGFLFSPLLKVIAIVFFSSTLLTLALRQLLWTMSRPLTRSAIALGISAFSVMLGMSLATLYGISDYLHVTILSIPQMAHWHGPLNALGFTLCGLWGWAAEKR